MQLKKFKTTTSHLPGNPGVPGCPEKLKNIDIDFY